MEKIVLTKVELANLLNTAYTDGNLDGAGGHNCPNAEERINNFLNEQGSAFKRWQFDSSAFNFVDEKLMKDIHEVIKNRFPEYYQLLQLGWCFFLYLKGKEIRLSMGVFGLAPSIAHNIEWVITSGIRVETHEDYTDEVGYFGSNSYWHDDFYRSDEPLIIR